MTGRPPGEVHPVDHAVRDLVRVGVVERDQRVLATEFQRDVLHPDLGRVPLDGPPGGVAADEADPAHGRMAHERAARRGPPPTTTDSRPGGRMSANSSPTAAPTAAPSPVASG